MPPRRRYRPAPAWSSAPDRPRCHDAASPPRMRAASGVPAASGPSRSRRRPSTGAQSGPAPPGGTKRPNRSMDRCLLADRADAREERRGGDVGLEVGRFDGTAPTDAPRNPGLIAQIHYAHDQSWAAAKYSRIRRSARSRQHASTTAQRQARGPVRKRSVCGLIARPRRPPACRGDRRSFLRPRRGVHGEPFRRAWPGPSSPLPRSAR